MKKSSISALKKKVTKHLASDIKGEKKEIKEDKMLAAALKKEKKRYG